MSVIKRLFGEHITSRLVRTQNRELTFRCIAYNMHRVTNLLLLVMISTLPTMANVFNTPTILQKRKMIPMGDTKNE